MLGIGLPAPCGELLYNSKQGRTKLVGSFNARKPRLWGRWMGAGPRARGLRKRLDRKQQAHGGNQVVLCKPAWCLMVNTTQAASSFLLPLPPARDAVTQPIRGSQCCCLAAKEGTSNAFAGVKSAWKTGYPLVPLLCKNLTLSGREGRRERGESGSPLHNLQKADFLLTGRQKLSHRRKSVLAIFRGWVN